MSSVVGNPVEGEPPRGHVPRHTPPTPVDTLLSVAGQSIVGVIELVVVALWLFTVVHIDTFVVLVAFCADEAYGIREIALGHYVGFSVGLLGALVAAAVAAGIFREWAFVLGLVPIWLGATGLVRRQSAADARIDAAVPSRLGRFWVVVAAGIGLSGENLAVFIPFFLTLSPNELGVIVALYLLAAGVVLLVAIGVSRWGALANVPDRIGHRVVPVTLLLVGIYVVGTGWFVG